MNIRQTSLPGVYAAEPVCHGDSRGWFMETYRADELEKIGITCRFVQDNHAFSAAKGTLRGVHFQLEPKAQAKLVRCTRGRLLDVAADLRRGSPNYRRWVAVELSEDNRLELFIPRGFGHGYLTLEDDTEIQYKADEYYSPEHDRGIRFDDPALGIGWGIASPVLSDKDRNAPTLAESDCNFRY